MKEFTHVYSMTVTFINDITLDLSLAPSFGSEINGKSE